MFLGYPQGTKGYKVYDIKAHKIIISRDVLFCEDVFPFRNVKANQHSEDEEPVKYHDDTCYGKHPANQTLESIPTNESSHDDFNASINLQDEHSHEDVQWSEPNSAETSSDIEPTEPTNQPAQNDEPQNPDVTRSTRTKSQPQKFKDFVVKLPHSINHQQPDSNREASTVHPISNFVSYESFSENHTAYLTAITLNDEPRSFNQASQDERWQQAMQQEIRALEKMERGLLPTYQRANGQLTQNGFIRSSINQMAR